jgi:hypothetical protein
MTADYIAFDKAFAPEYQLQVDVGQATAPDGVTRVRVDGAGTFEAAQFRRAVEPVPKERDQTKQQEQESERVSGKIAAEEAARLFEQASLAPWGQRFPQRPGIPDEAIVEVRFQRAQRQSGTIKLWLRDAEKDVALGPMLKQLRRHLDDLSGGRIYL